MQIPRLPLFENPPVVETVIGLFFHPLNGLTSAHQGVLWERHFRKDFPTIEEHYPLRDRPSCSGFEAREIGRETFRVDDGPNLRLWAFSENRTRLLQIQKDALLCNWLRNDDRSQYWHYDERKRDFFQRFRSFEDFVLQEGLDRIVLTGCLITYVNHVDANNENDFSAELARVFGFWTDGHLTTIGRVIEGRIALSMTFDDEKGLLYVTINPAIRKVDNKRVMILEMTARHKVSDSTIESASRSLDLCHWASVTAFARMTREEMHQIWERVV